MAQQDLCGVTNNSSKEVFDREKYLLSPRLLLSSSTGVIRHLSQILRRKLQLFRKLEENYVSRFLTEIRKCLFGGVLVSKSCTALLKINKNCS